ncbi:MAG TPA: hypothetical protein VFF60_06410, partial [Candidatus Binatus sp.]|nr:hypothetical protein [Candidatus Binatus sp.]
MKSTALSIPTGQPETRTIAAACAVVFLSTAFVLALPRVACAAQTIPSGSGMNGTLSNSLDTKSSYSGQPVSIAVVSPFPEG